MHFSSEIVRPPFEARSRYLQVTTGCSHNNCKFCNYYKSLDFNISSAEELTEDLRELKEEGYSFKRIWLQSADPFVLSFEKLEEIALLIKEYLPFVQSIGSYARADNLKNKTTQQLTRLKELGYDSIVFGVESGDDNLLSKMNKGYTSKDVFQQLSKMDESGMDYTVIFLNGLGGHNYGLSHARKTAQLINKLHPKRVLVTSLTVFEDTPLMEDITNGKYIEADEKERIAELKTFIKVLEVDTFIDAMNASNVVSFFGRLTDSKEDILKRLDDACEKYEEKDLRYKRENLNRV